MPRTGAQEQSLSRDVPPTEQSLSGDVPPTEQSLSGRRVPGAVFKQP